MPESLEELDKKIAEARNKSTILKEDKPKDAGTSPMRVGIELVSGVAVGSGLGYFTDKFFDTSPLFFLIFFMVGGAAGFFNIYRLAKNEEIKDNVAHKK